MDPVRTSHLRQFANAVSLALQGHTTRAEENAANLHQLLGALAVSMRTGQFMAHPEQVQNHSTWQPASPITVVAPAKNTVAETTASEPSMENAASATTAAPPTPFAESPKKRSTSSFSTLLANQFFTGVPWGGQKDVAEVESAIASPAQHAPLGLAVLAHHFFASLPWISRAITGQKLSIGKGEDNLEKARSLGLLTGRVQTVGLAIPGYLQGESERFASAVGASASPIAASGFFRKLPWAGAKVTQ